MKFLYFLMMVTMSSFSSYAKDISLNCKMTMYGNTTNVNVAKSWVNPTSKFAVYGNDATYYFSGKSLSGSAKDKGDRLKMYFSRMVSMKSGSSSKMVKANLVIDYFYKSKKVAADWRFAGYNDLGTVWGTCEED